MKIDCEIDCDPRGRQLKSCLGLRTGQGRHWEHITSLRLDLEVSLCWTRIVDETMSSVESGPLMKTVPTEACGLSWFVSCCKPAVPKVTGGTPGGREGGREGRAAEQSHNMDKKI